MPDAAVQRRGREGSRWYNARPSSQEVAEWFAEVPLHDGMEHANYISGVTLIPANEKSDEVVGYDNQGLPQIRERKDLVFVPYVKVETRVAYFWQLCALRQWVGEIVPVPPVGGDTLGLPPGFFRFVGAGPQDKSVTFVGCCMQVRAGARSSTTGEVIPEFISPPATKIVSVATRWDVDTNSLMKAETGAIGRALGFAGILVVPGSGVATAEDMADAAVPAGESTPRTLEVPAVAVTTPVAPEGESDEELRLRAAELVERLAGEAPDKHEAFQEWARTRKLTLHDAQGAVLRGAVRKLEKTLDALAHA